MRAIKEGDRVRIVSREPTPDDLKSNLYYGYFGGLTGLVRKIYNKTEAAIEVEPESLPRDIRKRHDEIRDQMKTKWLDGLSEEGRAKLTERERDFLLRYVLLVNLTDLERIGARQPAEPQDSEPAPHRLSTAELQAKEEAEFRRRGASG